MSSHVSEPDASPNDAKTELIDNCLNHPKFEQMVGARTRISFLFTLIIVVVYGIYILGMSFAPAFMAKPILEGNSVTYGILIALIIIITGMTSSGIYTWWANRKFDATRQEMLKELGYEKE